MNLRFGIVWSSLFNREPIYPETDSGKKSSLLSAHGSFTF